MIHLTEHKASKKKDGTMGINKMDGFTSINVSTKRNPFCQMMQTKCDTVCSKCYARRTYPTVEKHLSNNTDIMTSGNFVPEVINRGVVRLHSFGELYSEVHFSNILALVRFNPKTTFTLWTKRVGIVQSVLSSEKKPSNLILIYSSPVLNVASKLPKKFNKTFTVMTDEFIINNDITVNCKKQCNTCNICYTKNTVKSILEKLK